jgi:hypothetical protein
MMPESIAPATGCKYKKYKNFKEFCTQAGLGANRNSQADESAGTAAHGGGHDKLKGWPS